LNINCKFQLFLLLFQDIELRKRHFTPNNPPPVLLSQTGLFKKPVTQLKPRKNIYGFDITQALWSDYAKKNRWMYLPAGTQIQFSATEPWVFPDKTIMVKHFEIEVEAGVM